LHGPILGDLVETITLPACNQYAIQGDVFARCILDDTPVPVIPR
jgi:hypothetical protein